MSYDISITALRETEVFETNYTYNVSAMFIKALGGDGINDMHGKKCSDCIVLLETGIKDMQDNPKEYAMLNPSNGWGDSDGAQRVLIDLMASCIENPDGTITIS